MTSGARRKRECYSIKLKRAANVLGRVYDEAMEITGLTVSQFSLMNDIFLLDGCNKVSLAAHASLDKSTITRNLRLLKSRGYVEDLSSPDSRESQIALTQLGKEKLEACREVWQVLQAEVAEKIGPKRAATLMRILDEIEQF